MKTINLKNINWLAVFVNSAGVALIVLALYAAAWWFTRPEIWYAGEHTEGCDFTDNCGCYEKLMEWHKQQCQKGK